MVTKTRNSILALLCCAAVFSGCDKNDPDPGNGDGDGQLLGKTTYVIAASSGAQGVADYLLTSGQLESGILSTVGQGIEQDGSYRYYVQHKHRFFSLLYGQGNPGAVTTYKLNADGKLEKWSDFQTETVQVFAPVKDDLLLLKVPRSGTETALAIRINADSSKIVKETQINVVKLAGNGERAHFTWATQVGNKVFAPYMSIKGAAPDVFGTAYPDSTWIAVFSYPDLTLEKVIKDNRTSFIGAYFNNGLQVVENGDIYGFSPASATSNGAPVSTRPSAFVRIKSGTTEFDQSYFFNVQEKSGGYKIAQQTYFGNGKFLLSMYGNANHTVAAPRRLAIADVFNQTFTWVTGVPEILSVSSPYNNNTGDTEKSTGYVGINTSAGNYIYKINVNNGTATQGMKVEGGNITSIVKVDY
ncbi:DUF4374 domain-containing protein [Ravibacter arvi]|uniref:DUF4374 domain-containing protein n=1 Tax=Ravibacter arvi TaxID=2051041 RepID=A0ABP8LNV2_9BACT